MARRWAPGLTVLPTALASCRGNITSTCPCCLELPACCLPPPLLPEQHFHTAAAAHQYPPPSEHLRWAEDFEPPRHLNDTNYAANYDWEIAADETKEVLARLRELVASRARGCGAWRWGYWGPAAAAVLSAVCTLCRAPDVWPA
jgi:hypothetical protein